MTGQARLLVVDDEPSLQDIVATSMRFLGYQVAVAATGREAVRLATDTHPDLIILDVMLPDFDGLEVMKRVRAAGVASGVVFLSARDTPADKIAGLTAGGDDYVTKPFGLEELAARVAAVLRRTRPDADDDGVLRVADLQLDPETYQVTRGDTPIELAPTEYKMLRHMMINANDVPRTTVQGIAQSRHDGEQVVDRMHCNSTDSATGPRRLECGNRRQRAKSADRLAASVARRRPRGWRR